MQWSCHRQGMFYKLHHAEKQNLEITQAIHYFSAIHTLRLCFEELDPPLIGTSRGVKGLKAF
jgi:hypothetical protein